MIVRTHSRLWSAVACHRFSFCPTPHATPLWPSLSCPRRSDDWRSKPCGCGSEAPTWSGPAGLPHNSYGIIWFADPHPLTPAESHRSKNSGGRGSPQCSEDSTFRLPCGRNLFSCNTYESRRNCCKQKTYGPAKPFRSNTYKTGRGGYILQANSFPLFGLFLNIQTCKRANGLYSTRYIAIPLSSLG